VNSPRSSAFDVAFICTGNRFRSVLAAAAFKAAAADPRVRVGSFGTLDIGRAEPLAVAVEEAASRGFDISRHQARPVAEGTLSRSSLIIGFELQHVLSAIETGRAPMDRSFVLLEILDLLRLSAAPDETPDPEQRVASAHATRVAHPELRSIREIPDPVNLPLVTQREVAELVVSSASAAAALLLGSSRQRAE
jgi:protein-tyrosine phosphatase